MSFASRVLPFLQSEHQRHAAAIRASMEAMRRYAPLTPAQIQRLEAAGNRAESWATVHTSSPSLAHLDRIRNCSFRGHVYFETFAKNTVVEGVPFPSGLYNSTLSDAFIAADALVHDTFLLHGTYVASGASVVGCGTITVSAAPIYGNNNPLKVGVEIGGREIHAFADLPFDLAVTVGQNRSDSTELAAYAANVATYTAAITCAVNVIGADAQVLRCAKLHDVFAGDFAVLQDSIVLNSTVLSSNAERSRITGFSHVTDSILQWHAVVEGGSSVERAFLCEYSHVERHGIVMDSLLGPNTSIAEGEVTSSFLGPFVGFHHQAMIIASFWPEGKGNIGYGANVGSNHTLKAPDQELWPGEGVFYGLSVSVKFPSNFTHAPYSVLATGVNTLPQRLEMPFALVNLPGHNIPALSPAVNEIFPGWVLGSSIFTVLRNMDKFEKRNRATRTIIEHEIFRPEIVRMMQVALERLASPKDTSLTLGTQKIYTDKQVPGLGKNYMTEASRVAGIRAYTFFIRFYALNGFYTALRTGTQPLESLLAASPSSARWAHERSILLAATPDASGADLLRELVAAYKSVAKDAEVGKARDDKRGQQIIPDYNHVHKKASEERIVLDAQRRAAEMEAAVATYLPRL
ncbi:hypothetical protein SPRG_11090 [Saprolegnia parasitica CBS 223.65]|uniref:DUF4954 domain-containing protein n=1 Tax=Saprolegnia parasitica (strain CBS 223.65) TaxID=695850 RepID=A0A067CA14_SAPPC|nr:hypothetical protein SPRG_11090 [Saprolegnia parasitica CBS 223.65]KDO23642.1 hypothetical protein SPRG_11090 [Saprolegnia parasitica CBS 223.65]|eukprot:XP_012205625.1 hypothetical protein SPRG_11090 [Saprolegnia parasitica CBS 223.65]